MDRIPLNNAENALVWNRKRAPRPVNERRVLVVHHDQNVGLSLVLLLGMRGLPVLYAPDVETVHSLCKSWHPLAVLIDTTLAPFPDYVGIRNLLGDDVDQTRLVIGLSDIGSVDQVEGLRLAGFDGHCRRPCSAWHLAEMLHAFFHLDPEPNRVLGH